MAYTRIFMHLTVAEAIAACPTNYYLSFPLVRYDALAFYAKEKSGKIYYVTYHNLTSKSLSGIYYACEDGRLSTTFHRNPEEGPAITKYYPNGSLCEIKYIFNGRFCRFDGPAYQGWFDNGKLAEVGYGVGTLGRNSSLHREGGPASIQYHRNGKIQQIIYERHGYRHRPVSDGPAESQFYYNGKLKSETYWEDGVKIK